MPKQTIHSLRKRIKELEAIQEENIKDYKCLAQDRDEWKDASIQRRKEYNMVVRELEDVRERERKVLIDIASMHFVQNRETTHQGDKTKEKVAPILGENGAWRRV